MLDDQIRLQQNMRMNGNMTSEEKKLNKDDMVAYKNYDNKQYSLIPGVSKNKNFMQRERKYSPEQNNRIEQGYHRGVKST